MKSLNTLKNIALISSCVFALNCAAQEEATEHDAKSSRQIEVPQDFLFQSHRTVQVDVSVTDEGGEPLSGAMVVVYSILPVDEAEPDPEPAPEIDRFAAGYLTDEPGEDEPVGDDPNDEGDETEVEEDPLNIVFIGRTDENGWLTTMVDFPHYVEDVRVEVKTLGYEQHLEMTIEEDNTLIANF